METRTRVKTKIGADERIQWNDLDSYVNEPVFDAIQGKWRVLAGYKRWGDQKFVFFTDGKGEIHWSDVLLCKSRVPDNAEMEDWNGRKDI